MKNSGPYSAPQTNEPTSMPAGQQRAIPYDFLALLAAMPFVPLLIQIPKETSGFDRVLKLQALKVSLPVLVILSGLAFSVVRNKRRSILVRITAGVVLAVLLMLLRQPLTLLLK